jgi:YVTN family beta-propeller protein
MGGIRVRTQSGSSLLEVCVALLILGLVFPALMLFLVTIMKSNQAVSGIGKMNLVQSEAESFAKFGLDYSECSGGLVQDSLNQLNEEFPPIPGGPPTFEDLSIKSKKLTSSPAGVGVNATDLWVADAGSDRLNRYTLAQPLASPPNLADPTNRLVKAIPVGSGPQGVVFGAGSVWVSNFGSDTLSRINTATNAVTATRPVGDGPQGLAFGASSVWVANSLEDTVSRLNSGNNQVTHTIAVGDDPRSIAFDGTNVWVTNFAGNSVSKISSVTNTVTATVPVGAGPQGVAFGAGSIWVANSKNDYVSRINPANNQVIAIISPVGDSPQGVSFDGTSVWVANFGSNNLSKITPVSNSVTATVPVGINPIFIASGTGTIGTWVPSSVGGKVTKLDSSGAIDSSEPFATVDLSLGSCLIAGDDKDLLQLWTVKVNAPGSSKVIQFLKGER